jgi:site-specific recombinase XerC
VRQQITRGLAPRSVARSVAAIRGYYRFLMLDRRLTSSPADDLQPPRAWPALPKFLSLEESMRSSRSRMSRRHSGCATAR